VTEACSPATPVLYDAAVAPVGGSQAYSGSGGFIQTKSDDGTILVLGDGSVWTINGIDRFKIGIWLGTVTVSNAQSPIGQYTYTLTNTENNQTVLAKILGPGVVPAETRATIPPMAGDADLVKAGVDAALAPVKDFANRLFGPAVDEIGGILADPIKIYASKDPFGFSKKPSASATKPASSRRLCR